MHTNTSSFPRGIGSRRRGRTEKNSPKWNISKYGGVNASGCDISWLNGMNKAGLIANFCSTSPSPITVKPMANTVMSISLWLSTRSTISLPFGEADVDALANEPFRIIAGLPNGKVRLGLRPFPMRRAIPQSSSI